MARLARTAWRSFAAAALLSGATQVATSFEGEAWAAPSPSSPSSEAHRSSPSTSGSHDQSQFYRRGELPDGLKKLEKRLESTLGRDMGAIKAVGDNKVIGVDLSTNQLNVQLPTSSGSTSASSPSSPRSPSASSSNSSNVISVPSGSVTKSPATTVAPTAKPTATVKSSPPVPAPTPSASPPATSVPSAHPSTQVLNPPAEGSSTVLRVPPSATSSALSNIQSMEVSHSASPPTTTQVSSFLNGQQAILPPSSWHISSLKAATSLSVPIAFGGLVFAFVIVQGLVGRRDPKLLNAPIAETDDSFGFS